MRAFRLAKGIIAASILFLISAGAAAQSHMGGGHRGGAHSGGTHAGSHAGSQPGVAHFHGAAIHAHRGGFAHNGHFVHGVHGGVARVWWVSGGVWYPYSYPYAYSNPGYASVWYYCESARAYYPYVPVCPEGFVPIAPAY